MTRVRDLAFLGELHRKVGLIAVSHMRRKSRAEVPRSMKRTVQAESSAIRVVLSVPYFWAKYLHKGRRAIVANIIYFDPLRLDPRLIGGYPISKNQVKHLSASEFFRLRMTPGSGMIVRRFVGPARPRPFFYIAFRDDPSWHAKALDLAAKEVEAYMRRELKGTSQTKTLRM